MNIEKGFIDIRPRLSNDDDLEKSLSTFASEMATSAMILGTKFPIVAYECLLVNISDRSRYPRIDNRREIQRPASAFESPLRVTWIHTGFCTLLRKLAIKDPTLLLDMYSADDFVAFLLRYKFELPIRLPETLDDALTQTDYVEHMQEIEETQSFCATCILVCSLNHGRDVHAALDYIDKAVQAWQDSVDNRGHPWLDRAGQATLVVGITLLLAIAKDVEAVFKMFTSYSKDHQLSVGPYLGGSASDASTQIAIASYMLALSVHDSVEVVMERLFHTDPNIAEYYVIKYLMFYQLFLITPGNVDSYWSLSISSAN